MSDLTLALRITGDATGAKAAIDEAANSTDRLGQSQRGAQNEAENLNTRMNSLAGSAHSLRAAFGALVAGVGIAAFFGGILNAASDSEKTMASLEAGVRATGGAAGYTAQQLSDMSNELMKVSTYDDDAIAGAEKIILTFRNIKGDNFREATAAILDMSTVMGIDLREASIQVGKALQNPTDGLGALTRVGVSFTDGQKEAIAAMQAAGDVAGAQAVILDELKNEFGGAAEAAADTFGGALSQLKNTLGNLIEGDGSGLVDAKNATQELTAQLNDPNVVAGFNNIVSGVVRVTGALISGISELGRFGTALGEMLAGASGFGVQYDVADKGIEDTTKKIKDLEITIATVQKNPALQNRFDLSQLNQQLATAQGQLSSYKKMMDHAFDAKPVKNNTAAVQDNAKALQAQEVALSVQAGAAVSVASVLNGGEWAAFDEQQKKTTKSTSAANAALRAQQKAAHDAAAAQKKLADELKHINDTIDPYNKTAREMFDALDAIDKAYQNGTISAQQWQAMQDGIIEKMGGAQTAIVQTTQTVKAQKPEIDAYAELWKNALKRVDDAFVDLWKGAFSSFSDFRSSLTNAFKELLAQLANEAITKPIVVAITGAFMGTGSGVAQAASGQISGSSGLSSLLGNPSGLISGGLGYGINYGASLLGGAGTQQAGMLAGQTGAFGYGGADLTYGSLTGGGSMIGGMGGMLGTGVGGYLGGLLGGKFGAVGAGLGTLAGGIGGTALVGAGSAALAGGSMLGGAGAALGAIGPIGWGALVLGALASVLGGRQQDHSSSGTIDFATGLQKNTGGDRPNAESDKARDAISAVFSGVNSILDTAGLKSSAKLYYDQSMKYGFRASLTNLQGGDYRHIETGDTQAGIKQMIQAIVRDATGDVPTWVKQVLDNVNGSIESTLGQMQAVATLSQVMKNDPVANARADYTAATTAPKSAAEIYSEQTAALQTMASQFTYSEQSVNQLSQALAQNQQTAYALTMSYLQASDAIKGSIGALKDQISQSLMSDKELYDYRKAQADSLAASIRGMTDPAKITQTVSQIEQLTQTAWQSLADEQKKAMGGDFLKFLDDTNNLAQSQINKGLKDVNDTQASLADQVNTVMAKVGSDMQAAADKQLQAADLMNRAAERLGQFISGSAQQVGSGGGEVTYA